MLSAADGGAPPAAPAPRADARRGGAEPSRSGAPAGTDASGARDPADERADPAADAASPQTRRATADGAAHTHVAAHGRGQALAQARARAAAQSVERARAELASRGDAAPGETSAPDDGLAGPARGLPATGPLAQTDDAIAARDAALHAAAAAADPTLAPLIAAEGAAEGAAVGAPQDGHTPADAAARTEPAHADAALEGRLLAADAQTGRALATEIAAAAANTSTATAPAGGAHGGGTRHAGARAAAGLSPLGAGAPSAGAGDASVAGAQTFASTQAEALRALGERLRSGADGGADGRQTPTAPLFQPPLPAGLAAPRAEIAQERLAQGGAYPITVPVQDPRFADAFSERVTWLVREGLQGAELTLNPQELGPIRIELAIDGDAASIGVIAANAETRGAIEQALPRLREMLSAQGLQLGGTMVDAGSGRASQGDGGRDGSRGRSARVEGRDGVASRLGSDGLDPTTVLSARAARAGRIDVFA
ncbi:MAG: flagellar hook-length control protein FliK [Burkholderiales bacterium]|nr:flagellar hook-length control protein FliK [Burkholderiales bacterium]